MEPHALFFDIDCTLTVENYVIPERNITAINNARKAGHKVFINTGRSYGNIPDKILNAVEFDGVVSGNGSLVIYDGKILYSDFMSPEVFRMVAEYCFNNKDIWAVFEGMYGSYAIPGRGRKLMPLEKAVTSVDELMNACKDDKMQVVAVSKNISDEFREQISGYITMFRFEKYYDLVTKGNNKADSMLKVLDLIGIPQERSMAFGDSENDKNMLIAAGVGVAVKNSQPELLETADYITLANYESGVGYAIEELLLKGE